MEKKEILLMGGFIKFTLMLISEEKIRFVVGGRLSQVGEFPWAVLALRSYGSSCGGTLISDRT